MKHRPLLRLLFSPRVKEVTGFFGHSEWVLIYPASRRPERWRLLSRWLSIRDQTNGDNIAVRIDRLPTRKLSNRKQLVETVGGRHGE